MLQKASEYTTRTYQRKFVAPEFQRMIRAEAGASPWPWSKAVVDGKLRHVPRRVGQCVCVTCGRVDAWDSGIGGIHCGHFIASRCNSILYEEDNCACQCSYCNVQLGGNPQAFREWMVAVRGEETVEYLLKLRHEVRTFSREELVDMRLRYQKRLKTAEEAMVAKC